MFPMNLQTSPSEIVRKAQFEEEGQDLLRGRAESSRTISSYLRYDVQRLAPDLRRIHGSDKLMSNTSDVCVYPRNQRQIIRGGVYV